ncbi:MAG: hypothetical protein K8T90_18690 [Planctomycetes bacterium]|nr:hypothetical protein [Planctomycetota bacterium]
MDASIFDPVQGYGAAVKSTGELKVEASVPGTVTVTVSGTVDIGSVAGTVDVNLASQSGQVETTPGNSGAASQDQVDVGTSATTIVTSGSRKGLLIANLDSTKIVFLGFGNTPTLTDSFPIGPGATLALPAGVTTDVEVQGITATGTARVAFVEFT